MLFLRRMTRIERYFGRSTWFVVVVVVMVGHCGLELGLITLVDAKSGGNRRRNVGAERAEKGRGLRKGKERAGKRKNGSRKSIGNQPDRFT